MCGVARPHTVARKQKTPARETDRGEPKDDQLDWESLGFQPSFQLLNLQIDVIGGVRIISILVISIVLLLFPQVVQNSTQGIDWEIHVLGP
jgi:hypothetical protein